MLTAAQEALLPRPFTDDEVALLADVSQRPSAMTAAVRRINNLINEYGTIAKKDHSVLARRHDVASYAERSALYARLAVEALSATADAFDNDPNIKLGNRYRLYYASGNPQADYLANQLLQNNAVQARVLEMRKRAVELLSMAAWILPDIGEESRLGLCWKGLRQTGRQVLNRAKVTAWADEMRTIYEVPLGPDGRIAGSSDRVPEWVLPTQTLNALNERSMQPPRQL